jgi:hypothetical protein
MIMKVASIAEKSLVSFSLTPRFSEVSSGPPIPLAVFNGFGGETVETVFLGIFNST